MSFLIKDDEVWDKYDKIQYVIKHKLGIKFHSKPVYEYRYLKAKVREYDCVIKTNFLGKDMPKENMHYICIACITIDSVLRIDKKKIFRKFIQKWKYRAKKTQISRSINTALKSDSDSSSEKIEARGDNKLEKSGSDCE